MKIVNLFNKDLEVSFNYTEHFIKSVKEGFTKEPKKLSSEFFYDDKGSQLFQEITRLEEYYLTKSELEILTTYSRNICDSINESEIDIIELGVGDGHKTKVLLNAFLKNNIKVNFFAIDVSKKAIKQLEDFIPESNLLSITAIVSTYLEGLKYTQVLSKNKRLVLFLGSNVGNTDDQRGEETILEISKYLSKNDFLLSGFDQDKAIDILTNAYSDSKGVTKQFNMNLLTRMNNELGANFNLHQFVHLARYNPKIRAMESFLVSKIEQSVYFKNFDTSFTFREFEPIHLEHSFKYTLDDIKKYAEKAGFDIIKNYFDKKKYFTNSLWKKN